MLGVEPYVIDNPLKLPIKSWLAKSKKSTQQYTRGVKRGKQYTADIDAYHEHIPKLCIVEATEPVHMKFKRLLTEWREQAKHLSSVTEMAILPSYQELIGMGKTALPYLLNELKERPDHLFWALRFISGTDPVQPNDRGRIDRMAKAWIEWGRNNQIIA